MYKKKILIKIISFEYNNNGVVRPPLSYVPGFNFCHWSQTICETTVCI